MFTLDYLSALPRKDLQALAKQHGFKANKSTAELIQLLSSSEEDEVTGERPNDAEEEALVVEPMDIPDETTAESMMKGAIDVEMIVVDEKTVIEDEVIEKKDEMTVFTDMAEEPTADAPHTTVIPEESAPSSSSSSPSSSHEDETMNLCTTDAAATVSATNTTTEEEMSTSEVVMEPIQGDHDKSSTVRQSTGNSTTATKVKAIKSLTRPATIVPKPNKAAVMRQEAGKKATASSSSSAGAAVKETIATTTKTVVKLSTTASSATVKSSVPSSTFTGD